jgi:hypothetical protein
MTMKRSMALTVALLLGVTPVAMHAQGALALKAGLSYGDVSNRGLLPGALNVRTGFAVGASLNLAGGSLLGLGVDALYAERRLDSDTAGDSREIRYIDIPLYLRAAVPLPGLAPFAYAGPQVSREVSCRAGSADCPSTSRPMTTYAAVLGGGVRLGGRGAFSLEGRYLYGLTDLKLSTVTSSASYKTRSFLLLAGFAF